MSQAPRCEHGGAERGISCPKCHEPPASMRITVGIPTKGRYETLSLTLLSLAMQTTKNFDIIIVDDTDPPVDIRAIPHYEHILHLLDTYKIGWKVVFGRKLGQHHSHQMVQEMAQTDWIFRVDDDEVLEPSVLEILCSHIGPHIGAVAGLVLTPPPMSPGKNPTGRRIEDLHLPNAQWFTYPPDMDLFRVDHLHSTFLYRKGLVSYDLGLSPAAHREETIFTHELKRKGYKLLVAPKARTWHFRAPHGGIRSHQDARFWESDERLFEEKLKEWGVAGPKGKTVVIDGGRGDQVILKSLIPDLQEKYGRLTIACCHNDIFEGEDVDLISIAEARARLGDIDRFNIYKWCIDHQWKRSLEDAFRQMYALPKT